MDFVSAVSTTPDPAGVNAGLDPGCGPLPSTGSLERRLGSALLRFRDGRHYRTLGFVRLGDYVVERLGVSHRTAQELMRVEEILTTLPAIAAGFESGALTSSHVRILARVATHESEEFWVALAKRSSVRELAAAISRSDSEGSEGAAGGVASAATASPEASDDPWPRLEMEAPAWMSALWRDTVALVRRLLDVEAPAGQCLEVVLAEFGAGVGVRWTGEPRPGEGAAARELHASAPKSGSSVFAHAVADARALDEELRTLVSERQRHEAALAGHLQAVAREGRCRVEGFVSLEAYARERFGLSPRRLYYLLALGRTLERLPGLRAEFLAGRVTLRQALMVGAVASTRTEAAWIARAEAVTLRRLEDEVDFWRHLKETRAAVWGLLDGGPIPEGVALTPGAPPRLHASAPVEAIEWVRALEEDETREPMPQRSVRVRVRVTPAVMGMWGDVVAWCRTRYGPAMREWQVFALCLRDFWKTWDNVETRRQRRANPTLERDGWRCTAPACRSMGSGRLHEHHIVFRSEGGALNDPGNLTTLCVGHHLGLLHEGAIRCSGRAPDALRWEMGGRVYLGDSIST